MNALWLPVCVLAGLLAGGLLVAWWSEWGG